MPDEDEAPGIRRKTSPPVEEMPRCPRYEVFNGFPYIVTLAFRDEEREMLVIAGTIGDAAQAASHYILDEYDDEHYPVITAVHVAENIHKLISDKLSVSLWGDGELH